MRIHKEYKPSCSTTLEGVNEAARNWVKDLVEGFENKDPNFVNKFFEDSDDIHLVVEGVEPATGRAAVAAVYKWMFDAEDHVAEWDMKYATAVGNQIMFTVENPLAEDKDATGARLHVINEKSIIPGQEDKIKTMTLYGDYSKLWFDGYDVRSKRERSEWTAKSKRH